tara:strand:- start:102 stop:791 length:690 start_codon:yes stop_codon:yes gene_type:complete
LLDFRGFTRGLFIIFKFVKRLILKFEIKTMIKKSISIFFLFFLITNISFSQKLELGLKGGTNFATQKLSNITGVESITGYHLGGFLYFKLPILFGIQVEGQYSTQGSEFQVNQIINKNNLSYINVPILIRNDFGPFNFHFGPQFGILTDAGITINGVKNSVKNQILNRDFSFVAGVAIRLPANFGLSLRYVKGLRNISDNNILNNETKNTMFQLSIKYSLIQWGIKKKK